MVLHHVIGDRRTEQRHDERSAATPATSKSSSWDTEWVNHDSIDWGRCGRGPTALEAQFAGELETSLPGLGYWLHEDDDGSLWLLVSEDFFIGNTIRDTLRLDFDATGMRGGWSPAFLNWDDGVRAETAGINTSGPDGIVVAAADQSPAELARVAADWFTDNRRRWPTSDRGAGAARMIRPADERHSNP